MSPPPRPRRSPTRTRRPRTRPRLECLEARLAPAVLLTYGGPESILGLQELVSGATPSVTISEPAANQLRIDLGSNTFDGSSTAKATGLTYEKANSPSTSHQATLDISQANNITTLQAALPGVSLTLGAIADASGGLGNITASAAAIAVAGLDTSHATAGNGNVDLKAAQSLTVAPDATIDTGAGTLALGAGLNADGSVDGGGIPTSPLVFSVGATVISSNATAGAITLRSDSIQVDTSSTPATIGARSFAGGPARATLGGLVGTPSAMAFDGSGNLYVADESAGVVQVYAPGATTPTSTIGGLQSPSALTFDGRGDLYVADSALNMVFGYLPNSTVPFVQLSGVIAPRALAFDKQGNLYVANGGAGPDGYTVSVFAPGSPTPTSTLTGVNTPIALAFDASGKLYVANQLPAAGAGAVSVFDPGATRPSYFLGGQGTFIFPVAELFDAHGNLYVADASGPVYVFPPGAGVPGATITGFNNPSALAFDARGNLYVAEDSGTVAVVPPGSTTPTSRFSVPTPPSALLVSGSGDLYVSGPAAVDAFGPEPTAGGVVIRAASPAQPIDVGSAAGPNAGMGLSVAEFGRIFTTAGGTLTVGDPAQTGNITFSGVGPSTPGANVVALQSPTGPGAILLADADFGPSLNAGTGSIRLAAGTGGIVNSGSPTFSSLSSSGQVTLDTTGGIGISDDPVTFVGAMPGSVTVGATGAPANGVFLGATGTLALANVQTANAPLMVVAEGGLTVAPDAVVDTGTGSISLSAGVSFGDIPDGAGTLTVGAGAGVVSSNPGSDAITLRAYALAIATGAAPATVGLARGVGVPPVPVAGGVVLREADPSQPILVGEDSGSGLVLSKATLGQIFTTATGTLSIGDPTQVGNITFAGASPATTPGAGVAAIQTPDVEGGAIVLDSTAGTALDAGTGAIDLSAGPGGIVAVGGGTSLATTGPVTLDAAGGIGSSSSRLLFAGASPSLVTVGSSTAPASGVFLSAPGSLPLSSVATTNAALDVTAAGDLTVTAGAVVDTGTAPLSLAAGVNPDGSPSSGGGTLAIDDGAQVVSANPGTSAISLRGSGLAIDTIFAPVFIGATPGKGGNPPTPVAGGVVVRTARPDEPISLGATNTATGIVLSGNALARIFTTAGGTLTVGDPAQTGNITFAAVTPATSANVVALQSPTGPGAIVLDSTTGTALDAGQRPVRLVAGTGGIVAQGGGTSLSTTVPVTLDTAGGIGSSAGRVVLDFAATYALVTVGSTITPSRGVYLGGLGGVTLGDVRTADAPLDVTGALFVAVSPAATLDTGTGTLSLAAGVDPDGSPSNSLGVLGLESGATVVSRDSGRDAITLRGAALDLATGPGGAVVGARPSPFGTTPTATITGLVTPNQMALDPQGNLYVVNYTANTVSVFAPGSATPSRTLTGLDDPGSLAFDAAGNLYVPNYNSNTVSVFAPGATTPTSTLTGLSEPTSVAVDPQGFLYVGNVGTGTVSVFGPGQTAPFKTLTGLSVPIALTFDGFGNLYVANAGANTVSVFGPGGGAPLTTLTGLDGPTALTFDARGNLDVLNFGQSASVSVFAPGSTTPTTTLTGLANPDAMALDSRGNLYVANRGGSGPMANAVSIFAPGSTTPTSSLTGLAGPKNLIFDALGRLLVSNPESGTVAVYSAPPPVPLAGGVTIRTNQPAESINLGASSGAGLALTDADLAQLLTVAGGGVTVGDAGLAGNITVAGPVQRHPGYDTLTLQTQQGAINSTNGAVLSVANLALQAGTGIGTTGDLAVDVTNLAFTSQSGPIHIDNAGQVTLTAVGPLLNSSIPGTVFSSSTVGDVDTLLHSGGVGGEITYNGRTLSEGATLTLADGHLYRISYRGDGGQDVTLTRIASLTLTPPPGPPTTQPPTTQPPTPSPPAAGVTLVGRTLMITGTSGDDVVELSRDGDLLRVDASFLPAGVPFLTFRMTAVEDILVQLGAGNDLASVDPHLLLPVLINGGAGNDVLIAGAGRDVLIGGPGSDLLVAPYGERQGTLMIGGGTVFDADDQALLAILAEWASDRPLRTRVADLTDGIGITPRLNGETFLNSETLVDDGVGNIFLGVPRRDWLLTRPRDVVPELELGATSRRHALPAPHRSTSIFSPHGRFRPLPSMTHRRLTRR